MYSPKIGEKLIPELYKLGKKLKRPMTVLANEAVVQYLEYLKYKLNKSKVETKQPPKEATSDELSRYFIDEQKHLEALLEKGDMFSAVNTKVAHVNYNSALEELEHFKLLVAEFSKRAVEVHENDDD